MNNTGDYFRMTRMPDDDADKLGYTSHAQSYCKHSGLYVGCVCEYLYSENENGLYIRRLDNQNRIYLGVEFFEEYFRKDLRIKNLEKLGI